MIEQIIVAIFLQIFTSNLEVNKMSYWYQSQERTILADSNPYQHLENNILWTVEWSFIKQLYNIKHNLNEPSQIDYTLIVNPETDKFEPTPVRYYLKEEGMSRDNMISITSYGLAYDINKARNMGIDQFSFRYLQPQDFIWAGYTANKLWSYPLLPILCISMIISSYRITMTDTNRLDTDGRLLTWVRLTSLKIANKSNFLFYLTSKLVQYLNHDKLTTYIQNCTELPEEIKNKILESSNPEAYMYGLFSMYFRDENHPIRELAKNLYVD